jgi:peptidoglycan/xylan/chitin deacetylase (PgdA/CDA1 family)
MATNGEIRLIGAKQSAVTVSLLAGLLGLVALLRSYARFRRRFVPVLCYHALTDSPSERHDMIVQRSDFARQMRWLSDNGYRTVGCSALDSAPDGSERRRVAVTFDDGFTSVHRLALPEIRALDLQCTIFVSTDFMTEGNPFPGDYAHSDRPLTWDEVRELHAGGFEIASHACSHRHLPNLDDHMLLRELQDSSREIVRQIGDAPVTIAYPYGAFDDRTKRAVAMSGYRLAFAVYAQPETADRYSIPRILIRNQTTMLGFRLRVWGVHAYLKSRPWLRPFRRLLARWRYAYV